MKKPLSQFQQNTRNRLLRLILIMMIVVMVIYNLLFWWYVTQQQRHSLENTQTNLSNLLNEVDRKMEHIAHDISFSKSLKNVLMSKQTKHEILYEFFSLENKSKFDLQIMLLDANNQLVSTSLTDQEVVNNYTLKLMIQSQIKQLRMIRISESKRFLIKSSPIIHQNQTLGYLVLLSSSFSIESVLSLQPTHYAIISNNASSFVISDQHFVQGYLGKINSELLQSEAQIDQIKYRTIQMNYSPYLTLISFTQQENYSFGFVVGSLLIIIVGSLLTFIFFLVTNQVVSVSSQSVVSLSNQMDQLIKRQLQFIDLKSDDELKKVAKQVNNLVSSLQRSHQENIELLQTAHQFEHKQLMAQFNPHFLYNTLEAVRSSMYYDPDLASKILINLTKVLRYSLEEKTVTTLARDIEYLKDYVTILKMRLEDALSFEIENQLVDDHQMIPKLLLQPLIENSIKYGFENQNFLAIKVLFKQTEDSLILQVSDNGPGIETEVIDQLLKPSSHGVYNSYRRAQLFDDQAVINIQSTFKQGTTITIQLRRSDV